MQKIILLLLFLGGLFFTGCGFVLREKIFFILGLFSFYFFILWLAWFLSTPCPYDKKSEDGERKINCLMIALISGAIFYGIAKLLFLFYF